MASYYDFNTIPGYTLGAGVLAQIKRITFGLGERYLVVGDAHLSDELYAVIERSLATPLSGQEPAADNPVGRGAGLLDSLEHPDAPDVAFPCSAVRLPYKACTRANAEATGALVNESGADVVVAVGGSKVLDLVRAGLHFCGTFRRPALVMVPSVLNSNSCATSMSVIYDDEGQMCDFWNLGRPAEQVIVDTELLARVPARQLASAIGDQVSSSVEALHTLERMGGAGSYDPLAVAHHQAVLDVLAREGAAAVAAAGTGEVTPAFEHVCHAVTRYTGPELAIATSFLSHVLDEALIGIPELAGFMHGELVGFGVMAEMVAAGTPDDMYAWADLFERIGVPATLDELGIGSITRSELTAACERAADKVMASRAVVPFSPAQMAASVLEADALVRAHRSR